MHPHHDLSRRRLLQAAVATALGLGAGATATAVRAGTSAKLKAATSRSILILGGTGFIGPKIVEAALARGHRLTLFNRGKTRPGLFPGVEKLRGDRDGDLTSLQGRSWDAVIDTSVYVPRLARDSAQLLRDAVAQYLLVSTVSVYGDARTLGQDESGVLATIGDPTTEEVTGTTYGPLKALCEQAVAETLPGRATIVRPGLIVGPGDETDRFTYWPVRVARGGEVLAPGSAADALQIIDVRDLAEWMVLLVENSVTGTLNAVGPDRVLGMGELLSTCARVSGSDAKFTWVDAAFLAQQGVQPWSDLPVWMPPDGEDGAFTAMSNRRALAAGLKFRTLEDTVAATLQWFRAQPAPRQAQFKAGLSAEREREVLAAWHARASA